MTALKARSTSIKIDGDEVALTYVDTVFDEPRERRFYTSKGYVYERSEGCPGDHQVCDRLGHRGNTLSAKNTADLLVLIRREWPLYKYDMKTFFKAA